MCCCGCFLRISNTNAPLLLPRHCADKEYSCSIRSTSLSFSKSPHHSRPRRKQCLLLFLAYSHTLGIFQSLRRSSSIILLARHRRPAGGTKIVRSYWKLGYPSLDSKCSSLNSSHKFRFEEIDAICYTAR